MGKPKAELNGLGRQSVHAKTTVSTPPVKPVPTLSTAPGAVAGAPFRDEDAAGSEDQLDQGIPPGRDQSDTLDGGIESGDLHRSGAAKNLEELNSFTARAGEPRRLGQRSEVVNGEDDRCGFRRGLLHSTIMPAALRAGVGSGRR
ncbi:hypothetical protein ACWCPX_36535 [Streptomyces olivaceoviridis]